MRAQIRAPRSCSPLVILCSLHPQTQAKAKSPAHCRKRRGFHRGRRPDVAGRNCAAPLLLSSSTHAALLLRTSCCLRPLLSSRQEIGRLREELRRSSSPAAACLIAVAAGVEWADEETKEAFNKEAGGLRRRCWPQATSIATVQRPSASAQEGEQPQLSFEGRGQTPKNEDRREDLGAHLNWRALVRPC